MNLPRPAQRALNPSLPISLPQLHVRDLGLALFSLAMVAFAFWRPTDPDYGWHLRTGQLIVQTRSIPRHDVFSFTFAGKPWLDHEWLAQVVIYGIHAVAGYTGEVIVFSSVAMAALLLCHRLLLRLTAAEPLAIVLTLLATFISLPLWSVRPATFSILLTAVYLVAAYDYHRGNRRSLWLLPLVMVPWANLHGGYVLGIFLLGLLAGVEVIEAWRGGLGFGRARHAALVAGLCLLAAGLNPYTYHLWLYPFSYFLGDNASLQLITEWQPPALFHLSTVPLSLGMLLVLTLGLSGRRFDLWRVGIGAFFSVLALQSIRHEALFALAFIPVMGEALVDRWPNLSRPPRQAQPQGFVYLNLVMLVATAAFMAFTVVKAAPQARAEARTDLPSMALPSEGVAFLRQNYPDERMFNKYEWGGYLIDALYPQRQVFIDGRADLYGGAMLHDYQRVSNLQPGWRDVLNRYGIDLVLIDKSSALAAQLTLEPGWRRVFQGSIEVVFVRSDTGLKY